MSDSNNNNNNVTVTEVSENLTTLYINDIPEVVNPNGPMFSRLPNEIIFKILEFYMIAGPLITPNRAIVQKRFDILQFMDYFERLRRLNKFFYIITTQCFYSANTFLFERRIGTEHMDKYYWRLSFPPMQYRHFVRRVDLQLYLDLFNWPTVELLVQQCWGARLLRDFTTDRVGFTGLIHLNLNLMVECWVGKGSQEVMATIKKAGFAVRARSAVITADMVSITTNTGPPTRTAFPELAALIAVVE
jgi:hypothetical protein